MNIEELRDYCLLKPLVEEGMPFGPETLVLKCKGKVFLIVPLNQLDGLRCTMKCNPEYADELRTKYTETVYPGYHMNKKHWNTVYCNRALADKSVFELIDHSYELVSKGSSTAIK